MVSTVRLRFSLPLLVGAALIGNPVASRAAQYDSPLHLFAGQGATSDTNLFRVPDTVEPRVGEPGPTPNSRRDAFLTSYVGLSFDKSYRRQRVRTNMRVTHNAYGTYTQLNSNDVSGLFGWDFAFGRRWSGAASYQRLQTPINDVNQTGFRTTRRIDQRLTTAVDYRLTPQWSVGGGVARAGNDYHDPVNPYSDFRGTISDGHIVLRSRQGNQVRGLVRTTDGNYSLGNVSQRGIPAQTYRQVDYLGEASFAGTGRTVLAGGFGYSTFEFGEVVPGFENFSGPTGYATYGWTPKERTSISLDVRREIAPEPLFYALSSSIAASAATATVTWTRSSRFNLRVVTGFRRQRFARRTETTISTDPAVTDPAADSETDVPPEPTTTVTSTTLVPNYNYTQASLTGTWTPRPPLSFSTGIARERRFGKNSVLLPYSDITIFTNLQIFFR